MTGDEGGVPALAAGHIDRRIRHAMRILENEQTPLPETTEVASRVGLSLFHFVRQFTAQVGISPQDYGRSIVMMHSASRIRYSHDPIDVIAGDFGYAGLNAFSRAFKRHHGMSPGRWRRQAQAEIVPVSDAGVRLVRFPAQRCLARRYLGPRDLTAAQWADFVERLPFHLRDRPRLGFAYDDPRVTPPGRIRHDCAVILPEGASLSVDLADDGFEMIESPAGFWAVVDVTPRTIAHGYRAISDGWFQKCSNYAFEGDPHLERYGLTPGGAIVVSVCMRMRRITTEADWNMTVVLPGHV